MSRFDLDPVDRFAAGAVGEPGHRTFYLQVQAGGEPALSFKVEKTQVAALAGYFAQLLADLPTPDPGDDPSEVELVEPVLAEWVVGTIGVAYDETAGRFLVRLDELDEEDEGEEDEGDGDGLEGERGSARLALSRGQAQGFVVHAARIVSSGRPPCPLCGRPIDPEGHLCVKTNGHKH
ncbi:MAG TPA: DUF3090 family protein [Acidimicrobiia bacterium]|nr:DUF3090 family protein [Acidimicrobiia bacterium]